MQIVVTVSTVNLGHSYQLFSQSGNRNGGVLRYYTHIVTKTVLQVILAIGAANKTDKELGIVNSQATGGSCLIVESVLRSILIEIAVATTVFHNIPGAGCHSGSLGSAYADVLVGKLRERSCC